MRETAILCLRRMLNSPYHPYQTIPKSDIWWKRERMHRFTAVIIYTFISKIVYFQWSFGERRDTVRAAYRHLNKIFFYRSIQRDDKYPLMRHVSFDRNHKFYWAYPCYTAGGMMTSDKCAANNQQLSTRFGNRDFAGSGMSAEWIQRASLGGCWRDTAHLAGNWHRKHQERPGSANYSLRHDDHVTPSQNSQHWPRIERNAKDSAWTCSPWPPQYQ